MQVTRDAGARWTNVTANHARPAAWGTVSNIEPSRFDNGTAYVTVDLHQVNNRDPFVYKTTDYGRTWKSVAGDLPEERPQLRALRPRRSGPKRGLLYLGVENALYFSLDDGEHWTAAAVGLAARAAPLADHPGTFQRSRRRDIRTRASASSTTSRRLRQLTPEALNANAHLFTPRRDLSLPQHHRTDDDARRCDRGREPAGWRADHVLAEDRAAERSESRPKRREGRGRRSSSRTRQDRSVRTIDVKEPKRRV